MKETVLPAFVQAEVAGLTQDDFSAIRAEWLSADNDRNFADEESSGVHMAPEDITEFKAHLTELYLPYYTKKLREFIALKPDFFTIDGTSAIPHAYMFKSAFGRYAALHPVSGFAIPKFNMLDVSPLRHRQGAKAYEGSFHRYMSKLKQKEWEELYGIKGSERLQRTITEIAAHPSPSVIVFDEFSNLSQGHSLEIAATLLRLKAPHATIYPESPERSGQKRMFNGRYVHAADLIGSFHIYNPIKRLSGGNPTFRRPSLREHPIAHTKSLQLIAECHRLGNMIAQAA